MKKAFTMLELIMVIVIIGILAAVIIPRTGSNDTAEASVKLISDIRYAQHLAMVDDKYGQNATWYRDLWQINFNGNTYSVVSDNGTRFATNVMENNGTMQNIDLNDQFGVTLAFAGCAVGGNNIISFDHIGRPLIGSLSAIGTAYPAANLMTANCVITISGSSTPVTITIRPETGYASIS